MANEFACTKKSTMKYVIKTLVCVLLFGQLHAQGDPPESKDKQQSTNWLTLKSADQTPAAELANNKAALYLDTDDELTLYATNDDALGYRHYRYQQTYKGIPVEGAIRHSGRRRDLPHARKKQARTTCQRQTRTRPQPLDKPRHQRSRRPASRARTHQRYAIRMERPRARAKHQAGQKPHGCHLLPIGRIGDT